MGCTLPAADTVGRRSAYKTGSASSKVAVLAIVVTFSADLTHAQSLVPPEEIPAAARQIGSHPRKNTIRCERIYLTSVSNLGFDLRYSTGFNLELVMQDMSEGGKLEARIRVTPEKGEPVLLGEYFDIPTDAQALSTLPQPVRGPIVASVSGSFAIGPGKYKVEILLVSPENRTFFKEWSVKTEPSSGFVGFTKANTVEEVAPRRWDGKLDPNGIRLTVLLNATAISASKARLGDFSFLLTLVKTILERVPCRFLRIVAFNLDHQVELFDRDGFTADGWGDLEAALKNVQLSTIDYHTLNAGSEPDFLTHLVEKEISAPADAVVLVGRRTHFFSKTPEQIKASLVGGGAKLYYLRYDYPVYMPKFDEYMTGYVGPFGAGEHALFDVTSEFPEMPIPKGLAFEINKHEVPKPIPDNISYLVQDLHGTVIPFFLPGEFGKTVEWLRTELGNR